MVALPKYCNITWQGHEQDVSQTMTLVTVSQCNKTRFHMVIKHHKQANKTW